MKNLILTIKTDDLKKIFGTRLFVALPQEEIDRHYASIEVHAAEKSEAERDSSVMPLSAIIAVHYNYSWLTSSSKNRADESVFTLGFTGHIPFDRHNDIFLDESVKKSVTSIVNERIETHAGYDLRLAGLLQDTISHTGLRQFGLVYIARLRQPGVIAKNKDHLDIRFLGSGELQQYYQQFDSQSRILIDHITAL